MTIPKFIHQTISNKNDLDPVFVENISRLRALNSGWDYHLYDEEDRRDFISDHYGRDILETYLKISPSYGPAKADFFRYLLSYKKGGVYLDFKSTVTTKLDDVLRPDDTYLLSQWHNKKGEPYEGGDRTRSFPAAANIRSGISWRSRDILFLRRSLRG